MHRNSKADRYTIFIPIASTPSDSWPEYEPFTDEEIEQIDKDAVHRVYRRIRAEYRDSTIHVVNVGKRLGMGREIRVIRDDSTSEYDLSLAVDRIVEEESRKAAWDVLGERDQSKVQ